jgi:hypothetical protein
MGNYIKYSTNAQTNALKIGNFWLGPTNDGKGPTSSTGYYTAVTPPSGGYTIYLNKASGGPSIYTATNDAQLISLTNLIAGTSYTGVQQCFVYFYGQSDKLVVKNNYGGLITNGLQVHVDAGFLPSYPQSGTSLLNLSYSATTAYLQNGVSWADYSVGGAFLYDGTDDNIIIGYSDAEFRFLNEPFSLCVWANKTQTNPGGPLVSRGVFQGGGFWDFGFQNGTGFYFTTATSFGTTQSSASNIISNNTWYYLVSTYDNNGTAKLYLNGVDVTGTPVSMVRPTVNAYPVCYNLGMYNCQSGGFRSYFKGYIGMHSAYNITLSAVEVLQNFNATKSRFGY